MTSNLLGNPHSASSFSQQSTRQIEDVRLRVLRFFNAAPDEYDVVFVANATAGIKLVMEAFREHEAGYWYGYHRDSHTSLVGVRENAAAGRRCFDSDAEVERWLAGVEPALPFGAEARLGLFAYPAQSNMDGRRLPLDWPGRIRASKLAAHRHVYSLLDAAALVSTSALDLGDPDRSPDFTVLSFYKIFGFPDLGALIVRKRAAPILRGRKYFGGGTVEVVSCCLDEQWHIWKEGALHEQMEDGTLPFHDIMALDGALDVHRQLYGSMATISRHAMALTQELRRALLSLRHGNGSAVCHMYGDAASYFDDEARQGPVIAFNLRAGDGAWVSLAEVEKLAHIRNIYLRTGGLCNPGGVASALGLTPRDMKRNFAAGKRCGNENDLLDGRPSGMIRVSLGAMSNLHDVDAFVAFVEEFFVETDSTTIEPAPSRSRDNAEKLFVESLTIYPIKSCGGWKIPPGTPWGIGRKGLTWDRGWCLVHQGTGFALNQKRYPQMALLRPEVSLEQGLLKVRLYDGVSQAHIDELDVPLWAELESLRGNSQHMDTFKSQCSHVCGDTVETQIYTCSEISEFFSRAVGVRCHLARLHVPENCGPQRLSKVHLQNHQTSVRELQIPGTFPRISELGPVTETAIFLSNESPILTISRSSLNHLNKQILATGGKAVHAEVFRANVVIAEESACMRGHGQPYVEDSWRYLQIGQEYFQIMGSCRRCQMVCIDQNSGEKNEEPFVTLAKTRRFDGKVFFGQHTRHLPHPDSRPLVARSSTIRVGDPVRSFAEGDEAGDALLCACLYSRTLEA